MTVNAKWNSNKPKLYTTIITLNFSIRQSRHIPAELSTGTILTTISVEYSRISSLRIFLRQYQWENQLSSTFYDPKMSKKRRKESILMSEICVERRKLVMTKSLKHISTTLAMVIKQRSCWLFLSMRRRMMMRTLLPSPLLLLVGSPYSLSSGWWLARRSHSLLLRAHHLLLLSKMPIISWDKARVQLVDQTLACGTLLLT